MRKRRWKRNGSPGRGGDSPNGNGHIIDLRDLVKTYETGAGGLTVLQGVTLQVQAGEFVSVVGPSGSGKSTLLNMITGIDRPTGGEVFVGGQAVHTMSENELARWRGRNVGVVFQFFQLLPTLTALENVILPMDFCEVYRRRERRARAMRLLEQVGIAEQAHHLPSALSGGEQQRAAIARALANDPPIIVADEPTGNLDSRAAGAIFRIFENLAAEGKTIVMVTHDDGLARQASRTLLLADGEVIDETIASTLPQLTHQQMLRATKSLQSYSFEPGEPIIREGEPNEQFYMISRGEVDITLKRADGAEETIAHMGPGQYFGEVNMVWPGQAIASVKAALHAPVEAVSLGRSVFTELMVEAQAMRQTITEVAQQRASENANKRRRSRRSRNASYA